MIVLPPLARFALRANHISRRAAAQREQPEPDPAPVLKFFNPLGSQTWLATELAEDGDVLFGLCEALHNPKYVEHGVMLSAVFPAPLSAAPGHRCFA